MLPKHITHLVELLACHTGRTPGYTGKLVAKSGDFYMRLKDGRGITVSRAINVTQKISNHWPADLPWPSDIPRPAPSPDSPAAQRATKEHSAHPALRLSAKGQIRKPAALCALLGIDLALYYQATSQYGAGKARADKTPRKGSEMAALVAALALLGDRRFASRREMAQLAASMPGSVLRQRLAPLLEAA